MKYRLSGVFLVLAALGCGSSVTPRAEMSTTPANAQVTASSRVEADPGMELHADATSPAELRARVEHPLVRPSLAQIPSPSVASWVFAMHPGSPTAEESRPAFKPGTGEPHANMSAVTSDPVAPDLITTIAEADVDGARFRYVPQR